MFVHAKKVSRDLCLVEDTWMNRVLDWTCPLFARKFKASAASAIEALYSDCKAHLDVLKCNNERRRLLKSFLLDNQ
jgi:hypothetical protein